MAITAGQSFLFPATGSGSPPEARIVSQAVFEGGCAGSDLHVMRYVPAGDLDAPPVVATLVRVATSTGPLSDLNWRLESSPRHAAGRFHFHFKFR